MENEKGLCSLIYDFLMTRIRTGYYKAGDQIRCKPICDLFDVSNITVRNALRLLETEHYVSLSKNQRATVTWDPSGAEPLSGHFYIDKDTMIDVHISYALLQIGILWHGLRLFSPTELEELRLVPGLRHPVTDIPAMYLIKRITQQFKNPVMLDLHRDILLFTYPTTLKYYQNHSYQDSDYMRKLNERFYTIIQMCRDKDIKELRCLVEDFYHMFGQMPVYTEGQDSGILPHPFRWGKTNISFSVSCNLIVRISTGVYPPNTFMPSVDTLAKQYCASNMTIRRTIHMLNSLGVTETVNGVGTRVIPPEKGALKIRWDDQDIQKNMLKYLYTLQILLVTGRSVTEATFPLLPEGEYSCMVKEIEEGISARIFHVIYGIWLKRIVQYSNLAAVREIFGRFDKMLIWGIPLRFSGNYIQYSRELQAIIDTLDRRDADGFAKMMERYCYRGFLHSRQTMIELNIKGAENVAVPLLDD